MVVLTQLWRSLDFHFYTPIKLINPLYLYPYRDRNTRDTPKLMLEMPKPIPAPLVKSP